MIANEDIIVNQYRAKGLLVDTNLLLLLAVGIYRPARIGTFNRTRQYTLEDFHLIVRIVDRFDRRITTPNILTETDNLLRQLPKAEHQAAAAGLAQLTAKLFEEYRPAVEATQTTWFARLGLTDCVILSLSQDVLVVTNDVRLSNVLASLGRAAININHIRSFA